MSEALASPDAVLPRLPHDVLVEILLVLPAKSLVRFRSVCKNWCSLIQNPSFVANHYHRSKSLNRNESLLFLQSVRETTLPRHSEMALHFGDRETLAPFSDMVIGLGSPSSSHMTAKSPLYDKIHVLGPCNGIFCISDGNSIILSNPATRELKSLPLPSSGRITGHSVGFGYDPTSDDYKVSCLFYDDVYERKFEMYSLSTDSWKKIEFLVPLSLFDIPSYANFFNGTFHWGISFEVFLDIPEGDGDLESILGFDMKDEVFRKFELPDGCVFSEASVLVWHDFLAILDYKRIHMDMYIDLWVMKEYGVKESWTKEFSFGPLVGIERPLGILKDTELLLVRSSNRQLVSCDIRSHQVKEFNVYGVPGTLLRALLYTESLVSVVRFRQNF